MSETKLMITKELKLYKNNPLKRERFKKIGK